MFAIKVCLFVTLVSPYGTSWLLLDSYREIVRWKNCIKFCWQRQIFFKIGQKQASLHEDLLTFVISRVIRGNFTKDGGEEFCVYRTVTCSVALAGT
jgi:hypothetical protein